MGIFQRKVRQLPSRRPLRRRLTPSVDGLERREMLAANFLQGIAFVDLNNDGVLDKDDLRKEGAKIELRSADGSTLLDTRFTDSNGYYRFDGLGGGTFLLVEADPNSVANPNLYVSKGVDFASNYASAVSAVDSKTISVTLPDPNDLSNHYISRGPNEVNSFVLTGSPFPSYTTANGQFNVRLFSGPANSTPLNYVTDQFVSFCVDLFHPVSPGNKYEITTAPTDLVLGPNAGRIAYLYNQIGRHGFSGPTANSDAAGFQLALYELLYDDLSVDLDGDLKSGNFRVTSASPEALAAAAAFLTASIGQNEVAIYLDGTVDPENQKQGMIAAGSFNFANTYAASLGNFVWHDLDRDGIQDVGEPGINGALVELLDGGGTVIATTTTANDGGGNPGYYRFDGLTPGVPYQVRFTTPAGFDSASPRQAGGNSATDSDGPQTDTVILAPGEYNDTLDAGYYLQRRSIDIEKTTTGNPNANPTAPDYDNEDTPNGPGVPILTPGSTVTWTYKVTNTGDAPFTASEIAIVDDNGTPSNPADDLTIANEKITFLSVLVGDADNLLESGEVWLYQATGIVQNLGTPGTSATFNFDGSSSTDGKDGNIRTFTAGTVSVNVSAFSREKSSGKWAAAYLGRYSGGLGVTDSGEGDGSGNAHTVDNVGRDNFVLFEFSQNVIVDSAFLGYVVGDSDLTIWIGTLADPFNNHVTLSDSVLSSLGFTEVDLTDYSGSRTADFNSNNVVGNVLVIAAWTGDDSPDDRFKIKKLKVQTPENGIYANKATVTAPGADPDSDNSHYKNPTAPTTGSITGKKFRDLTGNGLTADDTPLAGVTVYLDLDNDKKLDSNEPRVLTKEDGSYTFTDLKPDVYIVREVVPLGWIRTGPTLADSYSVTVTAGKTAAGGDFANFDMCDCADNIKNIVYIINGCKQVSDLRGNVNPGDKVTARFKVLKTTTLSLVSYTAPGSKFVAEDAYKQVVYDMESKVFTPGTYEITVRVPNSYFQVDFVCGPVIDKFGPAGSNIFYSPQGRLISADNDGSKAFNKAVSSGDAAKVGFWADKDGGQKLIKSLNGGENSTSLATWLKTNFPNLFGSVPNLNTNAQVASYYKTLKSSSSTSLQTQVLALALSVYVTDFDLAGNAGNAFGFNVSFDGLASRLYNVGSNGSALGLTNGQQHSVMTILQAANATNAGNGLFGGSSTVKSKASSIFSALLDAGGIS